MQEEQFYTYLALTRASDALYLSYPAAAADGSAAEPSFLLERLKALGYYTESTEVSPPSPHHDDPSFLPTPIRPCLFFLKYFVKTFPHRQATGRP